MGSMRFIVFKTCSSFIDIVCIYVPGSDKMYFQIKIYTVLKPPGQHASSDFIIWAKHNRVKKHYVYSDVTFCATLPKTAALRAEFM